MNMVFYFIFLGLLLILWLLFVYNLNVTIMFSLNSLEIRIFKIPFIRLKDNKFKRFIVKLIPTNKRQMKEELDLSSLFALIHYDVIEVKVKTNVTDYPSLIILNTLTEIIYYRYIDVIKNNINKYTYLVEESLINDITGVIKCNFNIGIILINYLIIKGRYKYEKTS